MAPTHVGEGGAAPVRSAPGPGVAGVGAGGPVAIPSLRPFALSTVCLRTSGFATALRRAAELGFETVDLAGLRGLCEHVPVDGTPAQLRDAARTFARSRLRGASVNADPGSFDGDEDRDDVLRRVLRLLDFVEQAGVPLLVLPAGEKTERAVDQPDIGRIAEGLNAVTARARAVGARVAVEAPYAGRPVDSLSRTVELLGELDPDVELAFDVSHIVGGGESVADAWDELASRVGIVHLRDAVPGDIRRVIGGGSVDFATLFERMDATGYAGDVVLELETRNGSFTSKEGEVVAARAHLDAIRDATRRRRQG